MKLRRLVPYAVLLLLAGYAVLVEPRWVATRWNTILSSDWPGPRNFTIAVASDWHLTNRWFWRVMTPERARAIVQEINDAKPDIVLLPGDFIASELEDPSLAVKPQEIAEVLGGLRAQYGVYAVLGNHDWWQDGNAIAQALRAKGITVLENDAVRIKDLPVWVVGIGDDFTGHARVADAMKKVPPGAQSLVLMHDPASFPELPKTRGLVVAGHTHGGQVSVPFYGALLIPSAAPREWAYGWVRRGDNAMYVTSGLGVSVYPVRFNMRPEWALIAIHRK